LVWFVKIWQKAIQKAIYSGILLSSGVLLFEIGESAPHHHQIPGLKQSCLILMSSWEYRLTPPHSVSCFIVLAFMGQEDTM
jgi:hypothetical protein